MSEPETPPPPAPPPIVRIDRRADFVGVMVGEEYDFCLPAKDVPRVIDALCREGFDGMDSGTRAYLREQAKLGKESIVRLAKLQAAGAACPDHHREIRQLLEQVNRVEQERDNAKREIVLARNAGATVEAAEVGQRALRLAEIRGRNLERLRKKIARLEDEQAAMYDELDDARRALVKLAKGQP